MAYPGREEPLPYQTPVHVRMDMDEEEEACYERVYYPGPSRLQGGGQSYTRTVVQLLVETYAPQVQMRMGMEVLLGRLEAAGQPVPTTAEFLQDDLAVMVMEGLLDQIELMRRQRITVLEQIDCKAQASHPRGVEHRAQTGQTTTTMTNGSGQGSSAHVLPAWPPATPAQAVPIESQVPDAPLAELSLEQQDEEMSDGPLDWDEMALLDAMNSAMGPGMQGPSRPSRGRKPPLKVDNMEIVDFPAGVPTRADAAQLLFMLPITVPAPAAQFEVVVVATDPRTLVQYDGLMAEAAKTLAASKGKTKAIPTEEDLSDYGQSSEEEEEEEEEGEMPTQRFQCIP
ncbi:hypothetical protein E4T56_gene20746 [Termitomyces sp. T112]|nr:hypothetical protein E4T56_gene20746 [Termitomyces sp. T112]